MRFVYPGVGVVGIGAKARGLVPPPLTFFHRDSVLGITITEIVCYSSPHAFFAAGKSRTY